MAVLVFSWAYRAADGRRHDFTFLNQGTFFLKWGTFFLLLTKIKVVHIQGVMHNTNRHAPPWGLKPGGEGAEGLDFAGGPEGAGGLDLSLIHI